MINPGIHSIVVGRETADGFHDRLRQGSVGPP
jgi:hypothetical protein